MVSFEIGLDLTPALGDVAIARKQIAECAVDGPAQAALRDRLLAFCDEHDDCLHRSCEPGHLTASAVVVDPTAGETLLIHHAKLDRWLQPGGHADGDGNLAAVAWREATEETGLVGLQLVTPAVDVDIHSIPARPGEPAHLHLDLRHLVLVGPDREPKLNHETLGARWLAHDDPAIARSTDVARVVSRAVAVASTLR